MTAATPGKLITLASGDMALIQKGAWLVPYMVSGPFACIIQFVILYHIVRSTHLLDRPDHLLLCPLDCLLTGAPASSELSHSQNETLDRLSN